MRAIACGLCVMMIVTVGTGVAQANIITFQDQTTAGNDPAVQDAGIRKSVTTYPNQGDYNYGVEPDSIIYPDGGPFNNPDNYGPRHGLFRFDVSTLNDKPITSATFGFYVHPRNTTNRYGVAYNNLKLSAFLSGKDWIEGTGNDVPALVGEVTWNSQKHNLNPAWDTAGGTAATDIDMPSTKTFSIAQGTIGELRLIELNVTDFVQAWTSAGQGHENNGMQIWDGTAGAALSALNYWAVVMSENPCTDVWKDAQGNPVTLGLQNRPYLRVEYTPEPATLGLLALAFIPFFSRRKK